jgi:chromosomal replication initiator protein
MNKIHCQPCTEHPLSTGTKRLSPIEVIEQASNYLKLDVKKVISKSRVKKYAEARHMIADMLYCDTFIRPSLKDIGELFGNRDHTTIINSRKKISDWIFYDKEFRQKYKELHLAVYKTLNYYKHTQ